MDANRREWAEMLFSPLLLFALLGDHSRFKKSTQECTILKVSTAETQRGRAATQWSSEAALEQQGINLTTDFTDYAD